MTNFDENLLHIIELMLTVEEDKRPDFVELDEIVTKLFSDL